MDKNSNQKINTLWWNKEKDSKIARAKETLKLSTDSMCLGRQFLWSYNQSI